MNKLQEIMYTEVNRAPAGKVEEHLRSEGAHVVTADGREVYVIMTIEDYNALLPVNLNPPRQPQMARISGVLFREVV